MIRGVVRIPTSEFENAQQISVVAVNGTTTTSATTALPHAALDRADLRLANALPVEQPFSRQRRIEFSGAGETFQLPSTSVPKIELFDSIESVYSMYETLSDNDTLRTFRFIVDWNDLTDERKREKYSEFACHELNFYLYKKDKPFFSAVVQPYIQNKFHKTFLDSWLLGSDLSAYLEPWRFSQLNTFEKILLARRFDDEGRRDYSSDQ